VESKPLTPLFSIGQVVGDHYRVTGLLGRGSMGEVYEAVHELTGQEVAVKLLPTKLAADAQFRERFLGEARVLAKMDHPNIVPLLNFFVENGHYVLVMKRIRGDSVADHLSQSRRLPVEQALVVFEAVCAALEYAHANSVIHRDIKPANILFHESGAPQLVDFGLARVTTAEGPTESGYAVGTFNYMAPEQIRAEPTGPPADIYATGATVFEMVSGSPPFSHCDSDYDLLKAHVERPPPLLTDRVPVSAELSVLVDCCLKKKPEERPTATQVRAAVALELQKLRSASEPKPGAPARMVERPANDSAPAIEPEPALLDKRTPSSEEPVLLDKPAAKPERPAEKAPSSGMGTALALLFVTTLGVAVLMYVAGYLPDLAFLGGDEAPPVVESRAPTTTRPDVEPSAARAPEVAAASPDDTASTDASAEERSADGGVDGASDSRQLVKQATRLQRAGKTARAIELFERVLDAEPSSSTEVDTWVGLGWCYSDLGETRNAIRAFEQAIAGNPNMSDAHIGLAESHRQAGHAAKAIRHGEQYLRILPSGPDAALARRIIRELKIE